MASIDWKEVFEKLQIADAEEEITTFKSEWEIKHTRYAQQRIRRIVPDQEKCIHSDKGRFFCFDCGKCIAA